MGMFDRIPPPAKGNINRRPAPTGLGPLADGSDPEAKAQWEQSMFAKRYNVDVNDPKALLDFAERMALEAHRATTENHSQAMNDKRREAEMILLELHGIRPEGVERQFNPVSKTGARISRQAERDMELKQLDEERQRWYKMSGER
jgi:hypothetical protein